jgi:cyanophycin synthetase
MVELRILDGPNVYRLEPAVKIEVMVGRRRTWYGERSPGRHGVVRLAAPVRGSAVPASVRALARWTGRLHTMSGAGDWLAREGRRGRIPVSIHRTSEPGHWIVAFPWRERERAVAIAEASLRLVELDLDPRTTKPAGGRGGGSRTLARALARIREAGTTPPEWIRDVDRRIPIVSISGTNGKSTTTRMLTHILRVAGRRVGTTTSDGVLIDERLVEEGDLTGPMGAHRVLRHPDVDVAVLETARGGIVLRGIGYESNDASVITNVSSDHLDLHGIHTLPELAEVKSVVARVTKPSGVAVLNADDALVAALARRIGADVCLFSLSHGNARVRRHVARGGRAVVVDEDTLVEIQGDRREAIVPVQAIPTTLGGLALHNVANALAAAGAARALGASIGEVADGLRDFRPTADQAPGRLNLYRVGRRLVIVDFAHNEAGVAAVLGLVDSLVGTRGRRSAPVVMIVGTAGDRPDDTLRGVGRVAAQHADELAIKETLRYLRGRTRGSVIGELRAGMEAGGADVSRLPVHEDEPTALRAALCDDGRLAVGSEPAVVVLMCHEQRDAVAAVLRDLGGEPVTDLAWFEGRVG